MCKQLKVLASEAIPSVKPFLSAKQLSGLIVKCAGKEGEFYMRSLVGLAGYVAALPTVEDLPVVVNRMAYLHYCCGDADWYIVGLLPGGRMVRAFVDSPTTPFQDCGLVLLPGLFRFGVDTTLDIVFEPCPLASLEAKAAA